MDTEQTVTIHPYAPPKDGKPCKANPTQQRVLDWIDNLRDEYRKNPRPEKDHVHVLFIKGGVGSGKSRAFMAPIIELLLEVDEVRILWGRQDFKDIKLSIMDKFFEIMPLELLDNKSEQYHWYDYNQPKGGIGRIYFNGLKDLSGFSSQEFGLIAITEGYEITENAYRALKRRCRGTGIPNIILIESEAPNEGHWLSQVTDPSSESYDSDIEMWTVSTYENWDNLPTSYTGSLEKMPEAWKKKYLRGGWGFIPDGKPFYDGYKDNLHRRDIIVIRDKPLLLGWDYGYHHPAPYVADTEVLTEHGWKPIKDVAIGDVIASLNPSTKKIEYQTVTDTVKTFYKGNMYGWKNSRNYGIDVEVTDIHNMVIEQKSGLSLIEAQYLADVPMIPRGTHKGNSKIAKKEMFATSGQADGFNFLSPIDEMTEEVFAGFMGIWLSEGSRARSLGHYLTWVWQKEAKAEIADLLDKTPFKWSRQKKGGWVAAGKELYNYLLSFGNSYDKFVPREIKDAKPEIIKEFLKFYTLGDGDEKGRITTASSQMADDLQELFIKIGIHATIGRDGKYYRVKPRVKYKPSFSRTKPTVRKTEGEYVYCVSVPNHIICVRRNGQPLWCGNCVVTQIDSKGRWGVLREIIGTDLLIDKFADIVIQVLTEDFPGMVYKSYGDPAGEQVSDKSEETSKEILESKGFNPVISCSSTYRTRKEIIEGKLGQLINGIPALSLDISCKVMVDAFLGGYHYPVINQGGKQKTITTEAPVEDGYYEHPMNALEYIAVNKFKPVQVKSQAAQKGRRYYEIANRKNAGFGFRNK